MPAPPSASWRNRIVGHEVVDADQLLANPANWRVHPRGQRAALEGVLDGIGWVQDVLVNTTTGHLIDGHLRVESALTRGERVPVTYVTLTLEEERAILASLDPIGDLAVADAAKLAEVIGDVRASHGPLHDLLAETLDFGAAIAADAPSDPAAPDPLETLRGALLADPQHLVHAGDVWAIGDHALHVERVDHAAWLPAFVAFHQQHGRRARLLPYAGPLVLGTPLAASAALFLVVPDAYVAGHCLDRAADAGLPIVNVTRGAAPDPEALAAPAAPLHLKKRKRRAR